MFSQITHSHHVRASICENHTFFFLLTSCTKCQNQMVINQAFLAGPITLRVPRRRPRALPLSPNYARVNCGVFRSAICTASQGHDKRPGIRPKQSLGQNFLRDRQVVSRIVQAFAAARAEHCPESRVVEVGPGLGALTGELIQTFDRDLHAIEIDQRAVAHLKEVHPTLSVDHADVLDTDWLALSNRLRAPLAVIGNLPYNIVSQILLSLLEAPASTVELAVVMMQREVAQRVIAQPRCKAYGILSVVSQLYARPGILFPVSPKAFYPEPDVMSAMVRFSFIPHDAFDTTNIALARGLKVTLKNAFGQRRKVLRNSLKSVCNAQHVLLPSEWADKRAEELSPIEFVNLTKFLFEKDLKRTERSTQEETKRTVWR